MKKRELFYRIVFAVGIFVLSCVLRGYRINEPIADWHSFRQVDTAAVARMFEQTGIDILHPRYEDLSNIQSGKDNPTGWRMVEMPLYQAIAVIVHRFIPFVSLEVSLRLVTIIASSLTAVLLFLLAEQWFGFFGGISSALLFAVLPYGMYYGRVTLPESLAVFFAIASLFLLTIKKGVVSDGMSAVLAALSILIKPTAGFLLVPVPYLLYRSYGFSLRFLFMSAVYAVISLAPFWWWRQWILQFPEGIPASDWLFNKGDIRLKGAWFYWLFSQRIGALILGYWGVALYVVGILLSTAAKEKWTLRLLMVGSLAYLVIFAAGNVQHDYYQIVILPVLCLYAGKGMTYLLTSRSFSKWVSWPVVMIVVLFSLSFSWYTIRTYYWINHPEIIEAGRAADQLLPSTAKVIAPYNGDTTFLYQTKRQGWPLGFDIDKKIAAGATHYVTVSPGDNDWETKTLAQTYTVMVRNERYAIIDLTKKKQ